MRDPDPAALVAVFKQALGGGKVPRILADSDTVWEICIAVRSESED